MLWHAVWSQCACDAARWLANQRYWKQFTLISFRSDRHSEHLSIITQIKFPNHSATVTKCKTSAKPGTSTRPVFSIYPIQDSGFYNWRAGAVSRVNCSVRYKMRLRQSDSMDCSDGEIHMYDTEDMASSPGSSELDKYACTVMKVRRF